MLARARPTHTHTQHTHTYTSLRFLGFISIPRYLLLLLLLIIVPSTYVARGEACTSDWVPVLTSGIRAYVTTEARTSAERSHGGSVISREARVFVTSRARGERVRSEHAEFQAYRKSTRPDPEISGSQPVSLSTIWESTLHPN